MKSEKLTISQARRIAIAAQGLARPRPSRPLTRRDLGKAIGTTGLLQIDSVNVLTRMHYLPLFSRLGDYPRPLLEEAAWGRPGRRELFEYWAHEASLLPLDLHPLLRWRMQRADHGQGVWGGLVPFADLRRREAEAVLARIRDDGPLAASEVGDEKGSGGWWGWSDAKRTLEWLFWAGHVTVKTRRTSFERVYDLTERVIPSAILNVPTPSEPDAHRALLAIAARALGVAVAKDLRDYFRQSPDDAKLRIQELVESGDLIPVEVEGWAGQAFLHKDAATPRRAEACALLAPFDPLIWERSRVEKLFGVRYRIEIYKPADQREHGYYVLPFLLGEALVGRVDLKSDRAAAALRVQSAHAEPWAPPETAERLLAELELAAKWLGLETVIIEPKGDLAPALLDVQAARTAA